MSKESRIFSLSVCDAAAHKDCIPKASACRASPGLHGQFSGTSPFRPNVAARNPFPKQTSMPSSLSPDLSKHRKVSAPGRMRQGTSIRAKEAFEPFEACRKSRLTTKERKLSSTL